MNRSRGTTWLIRAGVALGVVLLFWLVPPFHVVRSASRQTPTNVAFDASAFIEKFWTERLPSAPQQATPAGALLSEVRKDPKAARDKYGRAAGLGIAYYYFLAGDGRVVSLDKYSVSLSLTGGSTADVVLETGNIFGNAIRDGTGLLNVSDFANSQDFNAISSEINRRIEEQVLPTFAANVAVGANVRFAGCTEITDESTDLRPLRVIPLVAVVQ